MKLGSWLQGQARREPSAKMAHKLVVEALKTRQIPLAFPLVRLVHPQLTLARWRRQALTLIAGRGANDGEACDQNSGIIAAWNAQGYILGLFTYRLVVGRDNRRRLQVDDFIAAGLVDRAMVVAALIEGLDALARRHRCTSICTAVSEDFAPTGDGGPLLAHFQSCGHRLTGYRLVKHVA